MSLSSRLVNLYILRNPSCATHAFSYTISQSCRRFLASKRCYATTVNALHDPDVSRTRNIGIIAHIDAGKTTTTERMLYYSGHTRRLGDVDDGSTVTDFLPAERARGITIQSAAITFEWPPNSQEKTGVETTVIEQIQRGLLPRSILPHQINLIDTPGHADFTFEVRRSLRILDGAVCILDGVAGVEAQTEQVWKQAGEWQIPRLVYVNKLDRDGAAFGRTVKEVKKRLEGWPAVCQIPWWEGGKGRFTGLGDVINLRGLLYQPNGDGKQVQYFSLLELEKTNIELARELRSARIALVELLSEHDDGMVESFLEAEEDHLAVTSIQVLDSLRRCLLCRGNTVIPIFAGASFRNIGVQPLLDAVVDLLPSPIERPDAEISLGSLESSLQQLLRGEIVTSSTNRNHPKGKKTTSPTPIKISPNSFTGCALAFKVVNDPRRGILVYVRVYSGSLNRNSMLYNSNLMTSEKATNLLRMYASDSVPVQSIEAGQIGVLAGFKSARTGDTLISYQGNKSTPPEPLNLLQLRPIYVPPPVFFAGIEPNSLREERDMHEKLAILLREDPSLHVTTDEDTGQTLLSGMGELHLEIARDRLVNDLKANATMGTIAIGYRETLHSPSGSVTKIFDRDRSESKGKAGCAAAVRPSNQEVDPTMENKVEEENSLIHFQDGNTITISTPTLDEEGRPCTPNAVALPPNLPFYEVQRALLNGALAALGRGPKYGYPMRETTVSIIFDPAEHIFGNETNSSALTSASRLATIAALKQSASIGGTVLMEPVMNVDISVDEQNLGTIIQDISSSRGGHIVSLGDEDDDSLRSDAEAIVRDGREIYAPRDPFESDSASYRQQGAQSTNRSRTIKAKVPLKEMVGYLKHLRSMTGGRGTFVMNVDRFEKMNGQREKAVLIELHGL